LNFFETQLAPLNSPRHDSPCTVVAARVTICPRLVVNPEVNTSWIFSTSLT
jgi:hypothetical protein